MARKYRSVMVIFLALCLPLLLVSSDHHGRKLQSEISHVTKLVESTDPGDVQGIAAIASGFPLLGFVVVVRTDPCLPVALDWVECTNDSRPRVTALNLGGKGLSAEIPYFPTMDALKTIDLHQNLLIGTIPSFLGTLPNLEVLNLAGNLLSGYVPPSILQNKKLTIYLSGNPLLQLSPPQAAGGNSPDLFGGNTETPFTYTNQRPNGKKKRKLPAIIGGSVSAVSLLSVAVGLFAVFRHKARSAAAIAQANTEANNEAQTNEETPMNGATTPS